MIEAFFLGLLGSLHCIGMCGPIAVSLPSSTRNNQFLKAIEYNLGRILAYGFLGLVFGLFGQGLNISGIQQWVAVIMGVLLITSVFLPKLLKVKSFLTQPLLFFYTGVKNKLSYLFKSKSRFKHFGIGFVNGFLPCGLVYIVIIGALLSHSVFDAIIYMIFFGIGTSPALIILIFSSRFISKELKQKITKFIPAFIVVLGFLFVLRGLGLGIPYLSPPTEVLKPKPSIENCH
jgi:uncharacterized protein